MDTRPPLSSGLAHIAAKLQRGGAWHDGFWYGVERADRSIDALYDRVSEHCDVAFAAMVAGACSLFALYVV
ncbi:MAG: hypothetical protein ABI599_06795 [Flavobacteriales bacterium]